MEIGDVFRDHHESLFRYLVRECGDAETAKDAVQETFLRLLHHSAVRPDSVRCWLFVTGRNLVRDGMRKEKGRARIRQENWERVPKPNSDVQPEERVSQDEDRARLRAALAALREKERTALLMRGEGFKHREIAEALGTTTATVGTLIARALGKLSLAMEGKNVAQ